MATRNFMLAAASILASGIALAHPANFLHHHHNSYNHQQWVPGYYTWTPKISRFSQRDDDYQRAKERCAQRYVTYDFETDLYFPEPGMKRLCPYVRGLR